jgi:hypothetical protein
MVRKKWKYVKTRGGFIPLCPTTIEIFHGPGKTAGFLEIENN